MSAEDDKRIHEALMTCCQAAHNRDRDIVISPIVWDGRRSWMASLSDAAHQSDETAIKASPEGALLALAKELKG